MASWGVPLVYLKPAVGASGLLLWASPGYARVSKMVPNPDPPVKAARVSAGRRGNSGIWHRTFPVGPQDASARWIYFISAVLLMSELACAPFQAGC